MPEPTVNCKRSSLVYSVSLCCAEHKTACNGSHLTSISNMSRVGAMGSEGG